MGVSAVGAGGAFGYTCEEDSPEGCSNHEDSNNRMFHQRTGPMLLALIVATVSAWLPNPLSAQAPTSCLAPASVTRGLEGPLAHVRYLSDDALEGRDSGTDGERCAADYLAATFERLGLEGSGEGGSFFQDLRRPWGLTARGRTISCASGRTRRELGRDWSPYGYSATGQATGTAAYGAYGISRPSEDDGGYGELELEGRVVVVEHGDPRSPSGASLESEAHFKASEAARRGAAALVVLLPGWQRAPGASRRAASGFADSRRRGSRCDR